MESIYLSSIGGDVDVAAAPDCGGRLGQAQEVAQLVAYLASPQAGYVSGQEIHINGGMHM